MAGDKLTDSQVQERVDNCFNLRYKREIPILQREWVELCHEQYGDKSEQQYCHYWSLAKKKYEEGWKEQLQRLLKPATEEIERLLFSENEAMRKAAVDQIYKYSGNDIQKIDQEVKQTIQVSFDTEDGD